MILERLQVLLEGDTTGLSGAFKKLAAGITAGAVFNKIVQESTEAQYAMAQLEAVVESTGGAAGRSVAELDAMSAALQRETTFSDDAVKSAEAMLLTFTRIAGPVFDRATRSVLDVATAMGTDAKTQAIQLGKALNDPTTGLTALTRVGITFSEAQKTQIKGFVETNRLAEAQGVILDELERQFGGSAAAARDTLGGALQALGNQWGDLFEVSRQSSGGIIDAINAMGDAIPHVRNAFNVFFGGVQRLGSLAAVGVQELQIAWLKTKRFFAGDDENLTVFLQLTRDIALAEKQLDRLKVAADETWDEILTGGGGRGGGGGGIAGGLGAAAEAGSSLSAALASAEIPARNVAIAFDDMVTVGINLPEVLTPLEHASDRMMALGESTVNVAGAGLDAFIGFATGASDAFGRFIDFALDEISRLISRLLLVNALKAVFAGSTGGIGGAVLAAIEGRASGGPVTAGRPYIVGERGPELIVPRTSGTVLPNGGGGGMSASAIMQALGPLPRPQSPREAQRDAWYREFIRIAVADNGERS